MIGGEIYNLPLNNIYKITRLTNKNKENCNTNILVKCIDDNITSQIGLSYVEDKDIYIDKTPNQSARTYATLIIEPKIDKETQKKLIENFNKYLSEHREKYCSLFLTNYRESKDIARKRISFDLVYSIAEYILDKLNSP
jgi:biotin-(acetyl-CoA carboxylase) ligase